MHNCKEMTHKKMATLCIYYWSADFKMSSNFNEIRKTLHKITHCKGLQSNLHKA